MAAIYASLIDSSFPRERSSAVLGGASALELTLEMLFRAFLLKDNAAVDAVVGPNGALGRFTSRIDLAYCLGLIDRACRDRLHLVRKVRNEFAHNFALVTLTEQPYRDVLRNSC